MRRTALALVLFVGCAPAARREVVCDRDPAVPAPACHAPPSEGWRDIVDVRSFRRIASARVCEWSRRCGWSGSAASDTYCLPGFAELDAQQHHPPGDTLAEVDAIDLDGGRACVGMLQAASGCDDALLAAFACQQVSFGTAALEPPGAVVLCATDADCGVDQVCSAVCVPRPQPVCGIPCTHDDECIAGTGCIDGRCSYVARGERCDGSLSPYAACAPGLTCRFDAGGARCTDGVAAGAACSATDACADGLCRVSDPAICVVGHIGCACGDVRDCPAGASDCVDGTCVAFRLPGETCTIDGVACIGGRCDPMSLRCVITTAGLACSDEVRCDCPSFVCDAATSRCIAASPGVCP